MVPILLSESQISLAIARHLGKLGNSIVSLALPGDGSGIIFHANDSSLPSFVPDIIARTGAGKYIVVESKPHYSNSDIEKLGKFRSDIYENSIQKILGVSVEDIITTLAFAESEMIGSDSRFDFEDLDLVYVVRGNLSCHAILNKCHLSNI